MQLTRAQRLSLFVGITFVGSWSLVATFAALGGEWGSPASKAIGVLHMLPPMLAALVVQGAISKKPIAEPFGIKFPRSVWFFIAWLIPVAVLGVSLLAALGIGLDVVTSADGLTDVYRSRLGPDQLAQFEQYVGKEPPPHPLMLIVYALLAGVAVNLLLSLFEELGWRGYLLHELQGSFWRRSLLIGLVWGLWFVPSVLMGHFYPEHRVMGAALVVGWAMLASPILCYVRLRCRSIFAAAVCRGTLTSLWPVSQDLVIGGSDLVRPLYGITGLVGLAVILAALWAFERRFAKVPLMAPIETAPTPAP